MEPWESSIKNKQLNTTEKENQPHNLQPSD